MTITSETPVGTRLHSNKPGAYVEATVTDHREDGSLAVVIGQGIGGSIEPVNFDQWRIAE